MCDVESSETEVSWCKEEGVEFEVEVETTVVEEKEREEGTKLQGIDVEVGKQD